MEKSLPFNLKGLAVDARIAKGHILPPSQAFTTLPNPKCNLFLPFNLDAEFVDNLSRTNPFNKDILDSRAGVSVQIRGVNESTGLIFAHPNQANLAHRTNRFLRHPVLGKHPCIVGDWLESRGVDVEIVADPVLWSQIKRTCQLQIAAHFAIADVMYLAGTSEFEETLVELYQNKKLKMARRLVARASGRDKARADVAGLMPWVIRLGEFYYRLTLRIVDSNGLHGIAGYADLAKNVGFSLDAKDTITRKGEDADIKRMDEIYFERPAEFDNYALGDLHVSNIIYKNKELWSQIWDSLGIGRRFSEPKLTVGASVADLIQNRIAEIIGTGFICGREGREEKNKLVSNTTGTHNASYLIGFAETKNPICLLSKVDGGRCRNANPILTRLFGTLADMDISGAYASDMTVVPLIFGKPRAKGWGNHRDSSVDLKDCPTLAEWLRCHEHQLVDRTWYSRINTRTPFSFDTDLINSWIDFRVETRKSDTELNEIDTLTDPSSGKVCYFTREIWAGTLTSDLLDVARSTMSNIRFKEWADKIVIRSCLYVDKKDELSLADFSTAYKSNNLPEYGWTCITIGELISDLARAYRGLYSKDSPLNTLYKLISNTTYGDAVSRHFSSSSVIAGSNITAGVRSFAYLAEKGLGWVGSITDGQLFDLNRVLIPRIMKDREQSRPSDNAIGTRAYRLNSKEYNNLAVAKRAPLIGKKMNTTWNGETVELNIEHHDGKIESLDGKNAINRIDQSAIEHLQNLWPTCRLLNDKFNVVDGLNPNGTVKYKEQKGLFRFETKRFVSQAAFHGSANYWHIATDEKNPVDPKMRSFESKHTHIGFTINKNDDFIELDDYKKESPAHVLLGAILKDPTQVPILPPFIKTRILKPGVYQQNRKFQTYGVAIVPGDSMYVSGRPRIFSLTQFNYQTRAQFSKWNKDRDRLIRKYGIAFEQWFTNSDGKTVNYTAMTQAVVDAIVTGVDNPIAYFDKNYSRHITPEIKAYHLAVTKMADHLNGRYGGDESLYETIIEKDEEGFSGGEWE